MKHEQTNASTHVNGQLETNDQFRDNEMMEVDNQKEQMTMKSTQQLSPTSELLEEMYDMVQLALPICVNQLGWAVPSFYVSSYVGRIYGSIYLDGYILAILTVNLCSLSLIEGVYSAMSTLLTHSYGAGNYGEIALVTIRSFMACLLLLIPFMTLMSIFMNDILLYLGIDEVAVQYGTSFYRIYMISLPFYALNHTIGTFLATQNIVIPPMVITVINALIVLPLLVDVFASYFGFLGTGAAIIAYQFCQVSFLLLYCKIQKPYHPETWSDLTWSKCRQAMRWEPMSSVLSLSFGGILASSEWIYWEILTLMIGTIGNVALTVHTIPSQLLTVMFMAPLGISIALSIQIGTVLPTSAVKAKRLCFYGFTSCSLLFAFMSCIIYVFRSSIYRLFTTETQIINGCDEIWFEVAFYWWNVATFAVNGGIAVGLGMQWLFGTITIAFLWVIGLPSIYYFAIVQQGGLRAAWHLIWPPYLFLNTTLGLVFYRTDWERISTEIRLREGADSNGGKNGESRSLVSSESCDNHNDAYGSVSK